MKIKVTLLLLTCTSVFAIAMPNPNPNPRPQEPAAAAEAGAVAAKGGVTKAGANLGGVAVFFLNLAATGKVSGKDAIILSSNIAGFALSAARMVVAAGILGGVAFGISKILFPSQQMPNADNVYQSLYGRIGNQIEKAINAKETARLVSNLKTLTNSINNQMTAYLSDMNIIGTDTETLRKKMIASGGSISIAPYQVDSSMSAINLALSSSLDWYQKPQLNPQNPPVFALTNALGIGANRCLRTKDSNLQDGTDIIVDDQCNMASLDDKMFTIGDNLQAVMLTNVGTKCLAYNSRDGNDLSKHISIYDINSKQCKNSQHPISFKMTQRGNWAIYDGDRMICVGDGDDDGDRNVLVNIQANGCRNNDNLEFVTRIPIDVNRPGAGGATGTSLTPSKSFDEIGIQVFYFPTLAAAHLTTLKEMYQFGTLKDSAFSQFHHKVESYKLWLDVYVPIFESYSKFASINSTLQIADAKFFRAALDHANISSTLPTQIYN